MLFSLYFSFLYFCFFFFFLTLPSQLPHIKLCKGAADLNFDCTPPHPTLHPAFLFPFFISFLPARHSGVDCAPDSTCQHISLLHWSSAPCGSADDTFSLRCLPPPFSALNHRRALPLHWPLSATLSVPSFFSTSNWPPHRQWLIKRLVWKNDGH